MTSESDPSGIAQQIADQLEPDWTGVPEATGNLDALRLLSDIANSFRAQDSSATEEAPTLFQWRHLHVREAIAAGAFGQVYRAYDPVLRREVALKLQREDGAETGTSEMVIAEARSMARVRHPSILAVHGADMDEGRVGIWSDLLEGSTLAELLEHRDRLTGAELIELAHPLATALALIHQRGLVHGDVKPANIMIQADGTPVLMDFGAAREPGRHHTVTIGSPRYMAPEQFAAEATTPASDLFALGVVLYRCLAGRYPWQAQSLDELERAYASATRPAMDEIPWRFRKLIAELLAYDPTRRPAAGSLAERLAHLRTAKQRLVRRGAVAVVIASLALGLLTALNAFRTEQRALERTQVLRDVVTKSLSTALPESTSGPTSVKLVFENLAARIEEELVTYPEAQAEMRLMVGHGLGRLGEAQAGLAILERTVEELDPQAERFDIHLSEAWMEIAALRTDLQDMVGAEEAVRIALEITQRRTDSEAPAQVLVARNKLMKFLGQQGRWAEQLAVQRALLADRQALHGENSLATAVDHHNLAVILHSVGGYDEALEHERQAGDLLRASGDDDSLRAGFIALQLGAIEIDRAAFASAQQHLDRARTLHEANLPAGHPDHIFLEVEQARLWRQSGDFARAEPLLLQHLGLESADLVSPRQHAMEELAYMRLAQERWREAAELFAGLSAALPQRLLPLEGYLMAAEGYARARAGLGEDAEHTEQMLTTAMSDLEARELTRIEPYRYLSAWRAALSQQGHSTP